LDFLGFPWILSSESRLFNELRGILQEEFFWGFPLSSRGAGNGEPAVEAMRKRRNVHGAKLNPISDFLQSIVARAVAISAASIQTQAASIQTQDARSKLNPFDRVSTRCGSSPKVWKSLQEHAGLRSAALPGVPVETVSNMSRRGTSRVIPTILGTAYPNDIDRVRASTARASRPKTVPNASKSVGATWNR
jgi:hypothetical protein